MSIRHESQSTHPNRDAARRAASRRIRCAASAASRLHAQDLPRARAASPDARRQPAGGVGARDPAPLVGRGADRPRRRRARADRLSRRGARSIRSGRPPCPPPPPPGVASPSLQRRRPAHPPAAVAAAWPARPAAQIERHDLRRRLLTVVVLAICVGAVLLAVPDLRPVVREIAADEPGAGGRRGRPRAGLVPELRRHLPAVLRAGPGGRRRGRWRGRRWDRARCCPAAASARSPSAAGCFTSPACRPGRSSSARAGCSS